MSAASALAAGRRAAESLMVDACTIRRTVSEATDRATGQVTPTQTVVYSGKCRLRQREAQGRRDDIGEASHVMLRLELQLPMSVVGVESGDEVTVDSSAHDPDLVGRVLVVQDIAHKTHATSRKLQVTEVTS